MSSLLLDHNLTDLLCICHVRDAKAPLLPSCWFARVQQFSFTHFLFVNAHETHEGELERKPSILLFNPTIYICMVLLLIVAVKVHNLNDGKDAAVSL